MKIYFSMEKYENSLLFFSVAYLKGINFGENLIWRIAKSLTQIEANRLIQIMKFIHLPSFRIGFVFLKFSKMDGSPWIRARNLVEQDGGGSTASTDKLSHVKRTLLTMPFDVETDGLSRIISPSSVS